MFVDKFSHIWVIDSDSIRELQKEETQFDVKLVTLVC